MESSGNRIIKNTSIAILYEIVAIIAGLILPRLILVNFGSSYNGVITSVTQFLSFVVLIRSGIGGVSKAILYKSLIEGDKKTTSQVMHATKDYMDKVSAVFLAGLIGLAIVYPFVVKLSWLSTALLVLICGLSALAENYFGITSMILLQADRREYLISIGDIVATVLNVVFTVLLVSLGFGVHIIKLGTAVAFCIKPIVLYFYVNKKYKLDMTAEYDKSLLNQKKDAFVHVAAEFVHKNTAVVILTIFTNTLIVSVYSVYAIVINGLRKLTNAFTANIEAVLGRLYAQENKEEFKEFFGKFEYISFLLSTYIYLCCGCLFASFINVYTDGITDIEYVLPLFAILLCVGEFFGLIKTPYQFLIRIAGHFKQTKGISAAEAVIDIVLSLVLVWKYDLVGVAVSAAAAMLWRACAYAYYTKKNIINDMRFNFIKYMVLSLISTGVTCVIYTLLNINYASSYGEWIVQALLFAVIVFVVIFAVNIVFCRKMLFGSIKVFAKLILKK